MIDDKNDRLRAKYVNGRRCPVCHKIKDIEEYHFSSEKPFRSNCNECNKLITVVAINRKKQKNNSDYCDTRISAAMNEIKILELIRRYQDSTDFDIAKIFTGVIEK
jgi:hypothetical protein